MEPSDGAVRNWLDNLYSKFQPVEQARWNQSNIDTLFYAGEQRFINSYFNFYPQYNWQNFHFNIIRNPINMVTGYQRQHRKSITYIPSEGADSKTTDQYTKCIMHANNCRNVLEKYSTACEQATISGMVLVQPYLDYTHDPINGELDLKVWEYNSFLVDPYFRNPDLSDGNWVWTQQYISHAEANTLFPDQKDKITPMMGVPQRYSRFYFLPENYNMARNDLLIMNYVWYKWRRKKKKLYNKVTEEVFDFGGKQEDVDQLAEYMGKDVFEIIEVEVPTWKLAVILNEQLMFQGVNPLGFDECPFVPVYWDYDPHLAYYDLRVRSLTRACRDSQYLLNRRIILNHDISESSINSGWLRRENAVANPENLRYAGQGKDIVVKDEFRNVALQDAVQKIIPNAVPPSDMQLADQMHDFIFRTTGVNQELLGMSDEKGLAGITQMLRQGAGLVTLQKYFDQWDTALKILGNLELRIVQNNWNAAKVGRLIGEEPTPNFFSKMFAKYHVLVEEGVNTTIQKQLQFSQLLELNQLTGGIIPPRLLLKDATIQGKDELIQALEEQQAQAQAAQQQQQTLEHAVLDGKLKELYSKAVANVATARERHGRAESNIGLFEERLSEITRNRALATKDKVEALEKMFALTREMGEHEALLAERGLERLSDKDVAEENAEKQDAKQTSIANDFIKDILTKAVPPQQGGGAMSPEQGGFAQGLGV